MKPTDYPVRQIPIADLIAAEYNPRRLTEKQFADLKKSMTELGILEPAVVNQFPGRENIIIGGHQRIKVAQAMGLTEYPCHEVQFPPEKEREANIRLNRNTGEWDMEILANEFDNKDLLNWGFPPIDLGMLGGAGPESDSTEPPASKQIECPHCGESFDPPKKKKK